MFRRTFFVSVPKRLVGDSSSIGKVLKWKYFIDKRGYHFFPLTFFCLTVPKKFSVFPFNVSEVFGLQIFFCIIRWYHYSLSSIFCVILPEISVRGNLPGFGKILASKTFMEKRAGECVTVFRQRFLPHTAQSFRRGSLHFSKKLGYQRNLCIRSRTHYFFDFFVWQCQKVLSGKHSVFQNFSGIEKSYG